VGGVVDAVIVIGVTIVMSDEELKEKTSRTTKILVAIIKKTMHASIKHIF